MNDNQIKMMIAFADSGMKLRTAARKVYVSEGTLTYNFRKIEAETGLNPRNFFHLYRLIEMAAKKPGGNHE